MDVLLLAEQIVSGRRLLRGEDFSFFRDCDLELLRRGADMIRERLCGDYVELCSIASARSGRCSENCKFCAQSSASFAGCAVREFCGEDEILRQAKDAQKAGARCFSLVASGRTLSEKDFKKALELYGILRAKTGLVLCGSLGFLTEERLFLLKEAGVSNYHHNIETSEGYFPSVCTSHSYAMKVSTIKSAKKVGLSVCSGGIVGMGESFDDRIDMALSLGELCVDSIPINVLIPIAGTPFEKLKTLEEPEILRTVAMFRYMNPGRKIRMAAGRRLMPNGGENVFLSGANAVITGDMLTTCGLSAASDRNMLSRIGRRF